jgi:hypothetical protein
MPALSVVYGPVRRNPDGSETFRLWELATDRSEVEKHIEQLTNPKHPNFGWSADHPVIRIGVFSINEMEP